MEITQLPTLAPYLSNPVVVIGCVALALFAVYQTLLKSRLLKPLTQKQSMGFVGKILSHGFLITILVIVFGFAYAAFTVRQESHSRVVQSSITQSGTCAANVVGDNNKVDANCPEKPK
jgi:ABC-type dipeptide/oligopeptide/nickel transport system permease component